MSGGVFISFEGGEGVGKTTQANLLAKRLSDEGRTVVRVHEPGGTPLGDYIRAWVKSESAPLTPEAELLLFAASRAELVNCVIRPALASGKVVIADRYADSTTVYQGDGRGMPVEDVTAANAIAMGGLRPNLTLLLDVSIDTSLPRGRVQYSLFDEPVPIADDRGLLRFEMLRKSFHQRVRDGYRRLAKAEPKRWVIIDASQAVEAIHAAVWERVQKALPPAGDTAGGGEAEAAPLHA